MKLTPEQISQYHADGYVIVPGFFNTDEARQLYHLASSDNVLTINAFDLNDQSGKKTKLTLWYTPGNDPYGLLTRSARMVDAVGALLGEEAPVCHFHTKIMQKEPRVGGAWEWHQDYGYWYKNGFLYPDSLISVMVALTEANQANGCLQVIKGSHKLGRVEHGFAGDQQGADQAFVDEALTRLELVYVEIQPGDTLFFHSNLLHRSEANNSNTARWSFISCYNLASNKPFMPETNASSYTPLAVVSDEAFRRTLDAGVGLATDGADFWSRETDLAHKR